MVSKKTTKSKKMPVKNTKKGSTKPVDKVVEEKEEEIDIIATGTPKKGLTIDVADILPEADEKMDDESTIALEDEDAEDSPSLDTEDLNPFGDKWEE